MKAMSIATSILVAVSSTVVAEPISKSKSGRLSPRATTDPQIFLYRFSGVQNTADLMATGRATAVFCSNYGNSLETIRIRLFQFSGGVVSDFTFNIEPKITRTITTHETKLAEDYILTPGDEIYGGHGVILGTTASIGCSAMVLDAAAVMSGVDLHMTRYNPLPGSTE